MTAEQQQRQLPKHAKGKTYDVRVGGQKVYVRTSEYEDGTLGKIYVDLHKESTMARSLINCFALAVSQGLQHGVPLEAYVNTFTFTRFEPQGLVQDDPNIKFATSVIDYVMRRIGADYLGRTDFLHVKPEEPQKSL